VPRAAACSAHVPHRCLRLHDRDLARVACQVEWHRDEGGEDYRGERDGNNAEVAAQEGLELATDTLRLAEKSFAIGESDLPSLLRARSSTFEAQALFNRQQTARAAGVSRLNQSLGVMP